MTNEQLRKGNELEELIKVTKIALDTMREFQPESRKEEAYLDDKIYHICICQYCDGSGINADLPRYYGNKSLADVIVKELERQLAEFEKMYEEL
jgi:hypothetical protein